MGGCTSSKEMVMKDPRTNQEQIIRIQKKHQKSANSMEINPQDQIIHEILKPIQASPTNRGPDKILKDIVYLSEECIKAYKQHDIDTSYNLLRKIQTDIKELEIRDFQVESSKYFKRQFIQLSQKISTQYKDMINFNQQILRDGWKIQKDKKNYKVSSRTDGSTVSILLQTLLEVPFQNFISVLIQPDLYKQFLPFIVKSKTEKTVARNCKIGMIEMAFPIISNRQSYFQGVVYNRLNNKNKQDQQIFMYTRSIHNRPDLQQQLGFNVSLNPKCVQFQYKFIVCKYIPLTANSGKMYLGVNLDLKLNMVPLALMEMVSISFSKDFYDNIVKISKNFEGSPWQEGIKNDPELFNFTKQITEDYLAKLSRT